MSTKIQQKENLFIPKLRVMDAKEIVFGKEFGPNHDTDYFWIHSDQYLLYQERMQITIYCPLEFEDFPFDRHECSLNIGVSSYSPYNVALLPMTILHHMDSTIYGEKGLYVHSTAPSFNAIVTGIKPFIFRENGYEFSFTGLQMQLCRTGLGLLVGGDLHFFIQMKEKSNQT